MARENDFTQGGILGPLLRFMVPVFFAMFLQAMYGAVDLLIVGQFGAATDVSAVSTGSQILMTLTNLIVSFAMGMTVLLGQKIGEGKGNEGGAVIGSGICLFGAVAAVFTVLIPLLARPLAALMNALKLCAEIPDELELVESSAIEPIQTLKTRYLGGHNPRLHSDETLIALSVSASVSERARLAMEQLPALQGAQAHSTVLMSSVDESVYRKLGIDLTCGPEIEAKD